MIERSMNIQSMWGEIFTEWAETEDPLSRIFGEPLAHLMNGDIWSSMAERLTEQLDEIYKDREIDPAR